jgi:hypothetical protein
MRESEALAQQVNVTNNALIADPAAPLASLPRPASAAAPKRADGRLIAGAETIH